MVILNCFISHILPFHRIHNIARHTRSTNHQSHNTLARSLALRIQVYHGIYVMSLVHYLRYLSYALLAFCLSVSLLGSISYDQPMHFIIFFYFHVVTLSTRTASIALLKFSKSGSMLITWAFHVPRYARPGMLNSTCSMSYICTP